MHLKLGMTELIPSQRQGYKLPGDFNIAAYDRVAQRAAVLSNPNDDAAPWKRNSWHGFSSAWNGIAIRLRSAIEYNKEFSDRIAISTAPPHEERYFQERALFGCVAATLSAVECFYVGVYCVASALEPSKISLSVAGHLSKSPHQVTGALRSWLPNEAFFVLLSDASSSPEMLALTDLRNTLAHRGVLPRQHFVSNAQVLPSAVPANPKALAADFTYTVPLSADTTSKPVAWVSHTVSGLVGEFDSFLSRGGYGDT